jgi:hypothetical protein
MKNGRRLSLRGISVWAGVSLGALLAVVAGIVLVFGGAILDSYGKRKVEQAFAKAHPGWNLQIGRLAYSAGVNRLVAQSVSLGDINTTLKVGWISLAGVRWARFFSGASDAAHVLAEARLDATNIDVEFPKARYGIRCVRLRASAPESELIAEGTDLRPLVGDEEFFAEWPFRSPLFHVVVPECRVLGFDYGELLLGKSCRASSVLFSGPTFDVLLNRDKPKDPAVKSPLMVNEALAAIGLPLQIDNLTVTNGCLTYRERRVIGAAPGVLTISAANLSAEGIANRGPFSAAIQVQAQGDLMSAATIKVQMSIPITPKDFSLRYSGSLGAMDLTLLDAFLDTAEHTRIKSGRAQGASFEVEVSAGRARGYVRGTYENLAIAVLDGKTVTEDGLDNRIASLLANVLKIRSSNPASITGSMKEGQVNYTRKPGDEFQQFAWFALRTGVLDIISH